MGRRGWAGSPPLDDADARKRIIDATLRMVDRRGPARTSVLDIADELGVTRRTLYRYFATSDELFAAAAEVALNGFVAHVEVLTGDLDVAGQLIEVVAFIIERLPHEPQLQILLTGDHTNTFSRSMLKQSTIARCREILQRSKISWSALGYDDSTIDGLVEFLLRIIQSMVVAPPEPARSGEQLRAYLRRWIGPALR